MNRFRRLPRIVFLAFAISAVPPALSAQEIRRPTLQRALVCLTQTVNICSEPIRTAPTPVAKIAVAVLCTITFVVCTLT